MKHEFVTTPVKYRAGSLDTKQRSSLDLALRKLHSRGRRVLDFEQVGGDWRFKLMVDK